MGMIKVKPSNGSLAGWLIECFVVLSDDLDPYPMLDWVWKGDEGCLEAEIEWRPGFNAMSCQIEDSAVTLEIDVDPQWEITEPADGAWPITRSVDGQTGDIFLVRFRVDAA